MRKLTPKEMEQEMMEAYYEVRRDLRLEKIEEEERKRLQFKLHRLGLIPKFFLKGEVK
tara:strand:+ start:1606 stop:1779 length:174 start_codon:yes stop_codon:yes gene_type:complete